MRSSCVLRWSCSSRCSSKKPHGDADGKTVRVAAASDLARAFEEVGKAFEKKTGITPKFNFGSSGLLAKQIEQGAPFFLFAAANKDFADQVDQGRASATARRAQLYARGRIVVWSPNGVSAPTKLTDLADPKYKRIAIANPDHAPYGKAAKQALEKAGIWDQVKDRLVLGENVAGDDDVRAARARSMSRSSRCRSRSSTTAARSSARSSSTCTTRSSRRMVVCGNGEEADAARQFADFIASPEGREIMDALRLLDYLAYHAEVMKPETLAAQALHAIDRSHRRDRAADPRCRRRTLRDDQLPADRRPRLHARREPDAARRPSACSRRSRAAPRRSCSRRAWRRRPPRSARSCKPGDHVDRAARRLLRAARLARAVLRDAGASALDVVDTTDLDAVRAALRPNQTQLVWFETPANPTWDVTDIAAVAELAHARGALRRGRLDLRDAGAHAAARARRRPRHALGDEVPRRPLRRARRRARHRARRRRVGRDRSSTRHDEGAVLGPVEAWLLLRGMRTLYARVERQSRTALALAQRLDERCVHRASTPACRAIRSTRSPRAR